jgi:hypothetical protein
VAVSFLVVFHTSPSVQILVIAVRGSELEVFSRAVGGLDVPCCTHSGGADVWMIGCAVEMGWYVSDEAW